MDETTKAIIKYLAVLMMLPWVIPFIKALFKDLVSAFEEDGGLLGEPPSPDELQQIKDRKAREPDPLVHEVLAHLKESRGRSAQDRQ